MRVQISTFNNQQHEIAKSKTTVKRTTLLADATNAKNLFVKDALIVYNVSAQAANKILAYCHKKLMCVSQLHITCLVRFDLFVLLC